MLLRRRALACLTVVAAALAVSAARQDDGRLSDAAFAELVRAMSEKDGRFLTENFVSNERRYLDTLPDLQARVKPGGVYIGVGPEQNFTYIQALRPAIAFVVDIRRQNLVEHLFYKAAFEASPTRADFLSYIFSRPRPPNLGVDTDITTMLRAYLNGGKAISIMKAHQEEALAAIHARFAPMLTKDDDGALRHIFDVFFDVGPLLTYVGDVRAPGLGYADRYWPTIATMMSASDGDGRQRSFMATEANYLYVKTMEERNLIVPLVGDFGGPKAVRAVGEYAAGRNLKVTAFYVSNVEQYLFQGGPWKKFYDNVATLPLDDTSTFIRLWAKVPIPETPMSLGSIKDFLAAYAAGKINNYNDVGKFAR